MEGFPIFIEILPELRMMIIIVMPRSAQAMLRLTSKQTLREVLKWGPDITLDDLLFDLGRSGRCATNFSLPLTGF